MPQNHGARVGLPSSARVAGYFAEAPRERQRAGDRRDPRCARHARAEQRARRLRAGHRFERRGDPADAAARVRARRFIGGFDRETAIPLEIGIGIGSGEPIAIRGIAPIR
ncbi:hypothetical protein [Burkholderia pseudomallei]|uniref:hypothetical protein n=1 Tax=Burkholderia pseudomallei TaxID=28450 RepID=UPI00140497B9|nr:hypothetical protein [Burkholderia pseudomallei]